MTYQIDEPYIVSGNGIAGIDTVKNHPYGKTIRAKDPTYGEGEFIYLQGVTANKVGMLVNYKQDTGVVTLNPTTAKTGVPVAVSMAAIVTTTNYGWYQIGGAAVILKTAVKVDPAGVVKVFQSGTAGRIMQTSASGTQIIGARFTTTVTVTSTTSTAVVQLDRPAMMGAIT